VFKDFVLAATYSRLTTTIGAEGLKASEAQPSEPQAWAEAGSRKFVPTNYA